MGTLMLDCSWVGCRFADKAIQLMTSISFCKRASLRHREDQCVGQPQVEPRLCHVDYMIHRLYTQISTTLTFTTHNTHLELEISKDVTGRNSTQPENSQDVTARYSTQPENAQDVTGRYSTQPEKSQDVPRKHSTQPENLQDVTGRYFMQPEKPLDVTGKHSLQHEHSLDDTTQYSTRSQSTHDETGIYSTQPKSCYDETGITSTQPQNSYDETGIHSTQPQNCYDETGRFVSPSIVSSVFATDTTKTTAMSKPRDSTGKNRHRVRSVNSIRNNLISRLRITKRQEL